MKDDNTFEIYTIFEVRNGDIMHVLDDPSYESLLEYERETQASINALDDGIRELEAENAKLRELVVEQRKLAQMRLAGTISTYWAGGMPGQYDALMMTTAKVNRLSKELRIEAV